MRMASLLVATLLLAGCSTQSAVTPHRLVSDNPCVDAILADVANPAQIGAISHYSQDARASSVPLEWARRFPAVGGTAEEVIAARPSLYLTSAPANPATAAAVARAGIPILTISVPNSIVESEAQIRTVAHAIGRDAAGEALVARMVAATPALPPNGSRTLIYQGGGLMLGAGTLADDELTRAGFRNAARDYSSKAWDVIPLERVIMHPPELLLTSPHPPGEEARSLAALRTALAKTGTRVRVADLDPKLLYCGAGSILKARARLNEISAR